MNVPSSFLRFFHRFAALSKFGNRHFNSENLILEVAFRLAFPSSSRQRLRKGRYIVCPGQMSKTPPVFAILKKSLAIFMHYTSVLLLLIPPSL